MVVFMQNVSGESFAGPGFLDQFRQCLELPRLNHHATTIAHKLRYTCMQLR